MKSLARNLEAIEAKASSEPYYPSITVTAKTMPELKGADVGDKGKMIIEYCVKGIHKYGNGETEINLDLEQGEIETKKKAKDE